MALVVDGSPPAGTPELLAGRYRIDGRIAKGGMAAVYRVFDQVEQRALALKRLGASDDRRKLRMFEREFYTLAGLKHPRIIEVYDYGVDDQGAYYTMELLDGRDLRELAPMPFRTACRYLRDVAASLALLHARNLLHRDLSPRNVRITSDERAKLIDFGALSSFGKSAMVVGTPPLLAPEALYGAQLDQRTDLYALGALAYWVLTGRHAFDVHAISELPDAWHKPPPPPSTLVAQRGDMPEALDDLVLALLSQNPLARPSCAAEVIARLSSIAGLPPDEEPLSALSYLHGGATVGRARERAQLRKRIKSTLAGAGSLVMISAEAGMGSARMLSELATESRLLGVTAIVIDAALHAGSYGVVEQIASALLAAHPEKARAAMGEHEADLTRFLPGATTRTGQSRPYRPSERTKVDPRETRLRTQVSLLGWIDELARELPLLIAVRGFHGADDSSATLLASLASDIGKRRVMLVLAYDPDATLTAPAAHAGLRELAKHIELRGLSRDEVRALVETTFGEVPNIERLSNWLHELTQGKPQACLDLLQHLIEQEVIRFADGVWSLPQELAPHELPENIGQALDVRIERLGPEAKRLALALCVERGAIPIERALALAELERIPSAFRALSELEQRGILIADDENLRFAHKVVRDAALRKLADPERTRLHGQLGRLIAREGGSDANALLDAGWHLLHGGDERRGADLLAEAGLALSFDSDGMPAAIPALEAALAAFHKQRRGPFERASLLAPLAISGFYTDRRVMETYGDQAVTLLHDVLGLGIARRLRPLLGARLSLWLGVGIGVARCAVAYGPRRAASTFREFLTLFVTSALVMTGLGTLTLDGPRARRYASMLEPLEAFGRDHAAGLNSRFARALAGVTEDRVSQTLEACRHVLARLEVANPIRELARKSRALMLASVLYTIGSLETFSEDPNALRTADRLDQMGSRLYEMFGNQIRANYHGLRGEETLAEYFRRRVELFAVQAGSSWQAELWTACSAILCYMLTADLVGLKRVASELERLSAEIPSLRRHAQLARVACRTAQGEPARARELGHAVLANVEPRGFIGWAPTAATEVHNIAALGEPEQARQFGVRVLSLYDAQDRAVTTMYTPVLVEVAMVEAQLGHVRGAADRIDDYLEELGDRGGPATRGSLHEARARIALLAGDADVVQLHVSRMEQCFRPTANPALIARCERLRRELDHDALGRQDSASDTLDIGLSAGEEVRRALRACKGREQRFAAVLHLLLDHTGAASGVLLGYEDGALVPRAAQGADPLPAGVHERLLDEAHRHANGDALTVATTASVELDSGVEPRSASDTERYRAFLLTAPDGARHELVAIAALALGGTPLRMPLQPMLAALAEALLEVRQDNAKAGA